MKRALVAVALVLVPALAHAQDLKDRFNIRFIGQGMLETEQELANRPMGVGQEAQVASPYGIGYGELRAIMDGRRLPGSFDLHLDGRVRLAKGFSIDDGTTGANQYIARGYLGGSEYAVNEAWVRRRGESVDFGIGRMIVAEADALRLDGARLWWRMAKHWDASLYAGAYPDPFSRSLTTDYTGGFAFAGGVDTTYTYDKIWGSVSVNSSYLGGKDDGGPLDPTALASGPAPGNPKTETPRTWITWTDYVRLLSWLDVFTDLVVDATGAAGAQLTRLNALVTARGGKHFTLHVGYDHQSAFAIEMWLTRLLYNRTDRLNPALYGNTIENNLVVERTARDEVRGDADVDFGKTSFYAEGRFRRRALVSLNDDPQFVNNGQQVAPGLAWDATFGVRDRGSLGGVRAGLWGMYLSDYRSKSFLAGFDLGRAFLDDRLDLTLTFLYSNTNDTSANNPGAFQCTVGTSGLSSIVAQQNGCYGTRAGSTYETGFTVMGVPFTHWFAFLDYRLVADLTGGVFQGTQNVMGVTPVPQPTILTHVLLLRLETRY